MSEVMEGGANNVTCRWLASDSLDLDLGKTDNHEARYHCFSGTRDSQNDICLPLLRILSSFAQHFQFYTAL